MSKIRKKKKPPKRVLALPDLEQAKSAVLNTLTSKGGQLSRSHDRMGYDRCTADASAHILGRIHGATVACDPKLLAGGGI
jgi:hypothetical protein